MKKCKTLLCLLSVLIVGCNNKESNEIIKNSEIIESSGIVEEDSSESFIEDNESESNEESSDSNINNSYTESEEKTEYVKFNKTIKMYINPSVQYSNLYASSLGNEGKHMNMISSILVDLLTEYTNLIVYANNAFPGKSLSKSVKESNDLNVDYHLSLHSNAGGGKGSEGWHTNTSKGFTESILTSLDNILPYKTRGLKYGGSSLYELKSTTASASLIEILFHDDPKQAKFIVDNYYEIAKAIYEGVISYFSKYIIK